MYTRHENVCAPNKVMQIAIHMRHEKVCAPNKVKVNSYAYETCKNIAIE